MRCLLLLVLGWRALRLGVASAASTALVLVDVWNDTADASLFENENQRMLPLLAAARSVGMLIIHAPSESTEWGAIKVLDGELLVTGVNGTVGSSSRCDTHILDTDAHGRNITHVLVVGYDTDKCVVDKPCGTVTLSTALYNKAEVIIIRDATLGQPTWFGNPYYGNHLALNMLELGWWLPDAAATDGGQRRGIRTVTVGALMAAFGLAKNAAALAPLVNPVPTAAFSYRPAAPVPALAPGTSVALVVVSCSLDYGNQGFRGRVQENRFEALEPLLSTFRTAANSGPWITIIHVPNGHLLDGACAPLPISSEVVVNTTAAFDAVLKANNIGTIFYTGYAANTDMLFGVGGMARYYSQTRYQKIASPHYYWVRDATIAVETRDSLEGRWAEKAALAYRQPLGGSPAGNAVASSDLSNALCSLVPPANTSVFFSLAGMKPYSTAADAVVDTNINGGCGTPTMIGYSTVTIRLVASPSTLALSDRKLLCFRKSVGSKFAVFQIRGGDANGELLYQTANATGWSSTLSVPAFFRTPNESVEITIVHDGNTVAAFRNGTKVATQDDFASLDYSFAQEMVVGNRNLDDAESWVGGLGDILIRNGSFPPAAAVLPAAERAALVDIYNACGGANWKYRAGTDAVGGGSPWIVGDPCSEGWFGVECSSSGSGSTVAHVVKLFPNTRYSGNELAGANCTLPPSISALTELEHLYVSNDKTPSSLNGPIPSTLGNMTKLKCIYFSHSGVEGNIPRELEKLTNLQVFLMRCNRLVGPLIDFTKLPNLLNVWFDTNALTGDLAALGSLKNLTFLQASNTNLTGAVPASLCDIKCEAEHTGVTCDATLPKGCCDVPHCGSGTPPPPLPPTSMGECIPQ